MGNEADYSDILVYIKKDGASKWLSCEFVVTANTNAQIAAAYFIPDYEADKSARVGGKNSFYGYHGP